MTTPLFMLRCCELGLSVADLDLLTVGLVADMFTEKCNDDAPQEYKAGQEDYDKF